MSIRYNQQKVDFMLDYVIASRQSGREQDLGKRFDFERNELVDAAEELYNKVMARCVIEYPDLDDDPSTIECKKS